MTPGDGFNCPRCGERLPAGFTRCDACGAHLVPPEAGGSGAHDPRAHGAEHRPQAQTGARGARGRGGRGGSTRDSTSRMTGSGWMLLAVGLLCGGALGYTLRGAVGPREEGGMPSGPADVMSGMTGAGQQGGANPAMPEGVVAAIGEYRQRLSQNPEDVEANIGMGNLLFDSGKWQGSIEHYQKALDKTPGNPDVRVDMAIAYHNLGQNERARDEMQRVTRESPEHRNAWLNLGVVSGALGDNAGAIRAWEQYLKLEPNGPHTAAIRAQIEDLKRGS